LPELADREAAQKARHAARIQEGTNAGWRLIDTSKECFKLNELVLGSRSLGGNHHQVDA